MKKQISTAAFNALLRFGFHGESYGNSSVFEPSLELKHKDYELTCTAQFTDDFYSEIKPQTFEYECFRQIDEDNYEPLCLSPEQIAVLIGYLEEENRQKHDAYLEEIEEESIDFYDPYYNERMQSFQNTLII